MPLTAFLLLALPTLALWLHKPWLEGNAQSRSCCMISDSNLRSELAEELKGRPGQDLVLVKDGPNNPLHFELVYNEADIDHSDIVWARSLGPERDLALRHYFAGRRVWEFEWLADADPAKIYRLTPLEPVEPLNPLNPAPPANAGARP